MLLLLSSGARPRYLDDIVRCLALPNETDLQFRYSRSWLSQNVRRKIDDGSVRGARALICYIDQSSKGSVHIVPCREADIIEIKPIGSSLAIQLRMKNFANIEPLAQLQKEISLSADCPHWDSGEIKGSWFFEQDIPSLSVGSSKLEDWEKIVKELLSRNDFEKRDFFFNVCNFSKSWDGSSISPINGTYLLDPSQEYDLEICHFHPKTEPASAKSIRLVSSSDNLKLFSLAKVPVDSRYDLKTWKFKLDGENSEIPLVLEIRTSATGNESDDVVQIDLSVIIKLDWKRILTRVVAIAGGFLLPSIVTLITVGKLSLTTFFVAVVGASLAAAGVIWKTK